LVLLNVPGAAAASTARTARTASTARTARTGASGDAWGTAEEVPGIAALNKGGIAFLDSVSCASAGNCGTGGYYLDRSGHQQVFAVGETKGTWGTAREVPGTAALNQGGYAYLFSVSCPSAGDCGAGGYYSPKANSFQAFVVGERDGTWGTAAPVPHLAALNTGADAAITGMSCASAGNCTAGGFYTGSARHQQAFVVVETKGTWQRAQEVPGTAALNAGGFAEVYSVSCPSAGNCGAGGYYTDSSGRAQAFVAGEVKGRWGSAVEVPGTAALNTGGLAQVNSVSCASPGNCSAGGDYLSRVGKGDKSQAFVAGEVKGRWGSAVEVPGTAALNTGGLAQVSSVSCASPGNCSAGGDYTDGSGHTQVFVVSEVNGTWRNAEEVPGSGALNQGGVASLSQVSCQPSGNCSAGGSYSPGPPRFQAFVASKVNGTWRKAEEVPGSGALDSAGIGGTISVSCPPSGNCSAGGFYTRRGPHHANVQSVFVVTETNGCSKRLGPGA
jgi:hypothetical protein